MNGRDTTTITHWNTIMKCMLIVALGLVAVAVARPDSILDFEVDTETRDDVDVNHAHEQEGEAGHSVTGSYTWESPEGITFVVKYIADELGYRVLESNAIPSGNGFRADGNQGDLDGDSTDSDEDDK